MEPITVEQMQQRHRDLVADLQQTEQQLAMWSEKRGLLRGALLELEGWMRGDLSPKEPAAPETT